MTMTPPHPRHLPYVLRVIRARPRLMISIAVGFAVLVLITLGDDRAVSRTYVLGREVYTAGATCSPSAAGA